MEERQSTTNINDINMPNTTRVHIHNSVHQLPVLTTLEALGYVQYYNKENNRMTREENIKEIREMFDLYGNQTRQIETEYHEPSKEIMYLYCKHLREYIKDHIKGDIKTFYSNDMVVVDIQIGDIHYRYSENDMFTKIEQGYNAHMYAVDVEKAYMQYLRKKYFF